MGGRDSGNYRLQRKRSKSYPKDRICFLPENENSAILDKATFEKYHNKQITLAEACKSIAWANYLDEVTPEQFIKAYKELGFDYD